MPVFVKSSDKIFIEEFLVNFFLSLDYFIKNVFLGTVYKQHNVALTSTQAHFCFCCCAVGISYKNTLVHC
jgi:hypothetical protein